MSALLNFKSQSGEQMCNYKDPNDFFEWYGQENKLCAINMH